MGKHAAGERHALVGPLHARDSAGGGAARLLRGAFPASMPCLHSTLLSPSTPTTPLHPLADAMLSPLDTSRMTILARTKPRTLSCERLRQARDRRCHALLAPARRRVETTSSSLSAPCESSTPVFLLLLPPLLWLFQPGPVCEKEKPLPHPASFTKAE